MHNFSTDAGCKGASEKSDENNEARYLAQPFPAVTEREQQVLDLLVSGKSNKEIARQLQISVHTAKMHVSRVLHKLGVESRTEAAVFWERRKNLLRRPEGSMPVDSPLDRCWRYPHEHRTPHP